MANAVVDRVLVEAGMVRDTTYMIGVYTVHIPPQPHHKLRGATYGERLVGAGVVVDTIVLVRGVTIGIAVVHLCPPWVLHRLADGGHLAIDKVILWLWF